MNTSELVGLLPAEHEHALIDAITPAMRWDGQTEPAEWQHAARTRLAGLLGLAQIEHCRTDPRLTVEYDRYDEKLHAREIRFRFFSEENVSVPCHLLIPADAEGPLPVVLCLQGHSTGMHISLGRPKYPGDEKTICGGDRDFAVRAVRERMCALTLEQRCMGERGGTPNGPACQEPALRALLLGRTMIGERVWDIMRAIDVLESGFPAEVDTAHITCLGNSGGGTATIYAAALDPRINIAVPACSVCRYADSIAAMAHCACNYVPGIVLDFDMGELCAMVAPRPLLVVNGRYDPIFPLSGAEACVAEARRLYEAMGAGDRLHQSIGDGVHRFYADDTWPVLREEIDQILAVDCGQ